MGGDTGGGSGSTYFARNGGSSQTSTNQLDDAFRGVLGSQLTNRPKDNTGFEYLLSQMVSPTNYEANTQAQFENRMLRGLALSRSGPQAVMAPLARGFGQSQSEVIEDMSRGRGQEVRQQQLIDRQLGTQAAGAFNQGQQGDKSVDTNTLVSLANLLYPRSQSVSEDYTGYGNQSSSAYNFGGQLCCFIFLEFYNGEMPAHVRECRDEFAPESSGRRVGYIAMSKWLVPAMRVSKTVRKIVEVTMVRPLTQWGGWYKKIDGYERSEKYGLVKTTWFGIWTLIGKLKGVK